MLSIFFFYITQIATYLTIHKQYIILKHNANTFLTGVNPAEVAPVIGEPIQQRDTTEDEPEPDRAVVKVGPVVPAVEQQQQPPVAKGNFPFLHTSYYFVSTFC